jgi:hypothetical protein
MKKHLVGILTWLIPFLAGQATYAVDVTLTSFLLLVVVCAFHGVIVDWYADLEG